MGGKSSKKKRSRNDPLYAEGDELPEEARERKITQHRLANGGAAPTKKNTVNATSTFSLRSSIKSGMYGPGEPGDNDSIKSWYTDHSSIRQIEYENYEYPYENIVFEGGGSKGIAYAGAVAELERVGIMKNIKRFAGASAGSMSAAMLSIGYTADEVKQFLCIDFRPYFLDAKCGGCSFLPNMLNHFGWHPARRYFEWFGDRLDEKVGNRDITFEDLYKLNGKELCIIVTNLNQMDAEYCHVKTTPKMTIRTAVRMSMAIPGIFCAVQYRRFGTISHYVDGGMICNYPIHCFDGWYLSLKLEDSFLRRLQPLENLAKLWDKKERFGTFNEKTLGMMLYSTEEQELMASEFANINHGEPPNRPNTKLSRERNHMNTIKEKATREHAMVTSSLSSFLRVLADSQLDQKPSVSKEELKEAFNNHNAFIDDHAKILFGEDFTVDDVFEYLDCNDDGEIDFNELMAFAEQKGIGIYTQFVGYKQKPIHKLSDFLVALQDTLLLNVKRVFMDDEDVERTIGIDTLYVLTADFDLEKDDKLFLVQQGERATRSFLRHYVRNNQPKLKPEFSPDVDIHDSATNDIRSTPPLSAQTRTSFVEVKSAATSHESTPSISPPIPLPNNDLQAAAEKQEPNRVARGTKKNSIEPLQ